MTEGFAKDCQSADECVDYLSVCMCVCVRMEGSVIVSVCVFGLFIAWMCVCESLAVEWKWIGGGGGHCVDWMTT